MRSNQLKNSEGAALVSVLWVIAILTSIAATATTNSRTDVRLSQNLLESAKIRQALDGAVRVGVASLVSRSQTSVSPGSRLRQDFELAGHKVSVEVASESGRIDINHASHELLQGLLLQFAAEDQANHIADAILDWRDDDDDRRLAGAEAQDYFAAGRNYAPSNSNFLSVHELRFVLGMNPELLRTIEPFITVFSGQAGVFPIAADTEVLVAAGGVLHDRSGPGSRQSHAISGLRRNLIAARPGNIYRIEATVTTAAGGKTGFGTVVRFEPTRRPEPFTILASNLPMPPAKGATIQ